MDSLSSLTLSPVQELSPQTPKYAACDKGVNGGINHRGKKQVLEPSTADTKIDKQSRDDSSHATEGSQPVLLNRKLISRYDYGGSGLTSKQLLTEDTTEDTGNNDSDYNSDTTCSSGNNTGCSIGCD